MKKCKNHVPSYRLHKASGQAVVVINGKTCYLGKHGSQPSRETYARAIAEWSAQGRMPITDKGGITVNEVMAAYVEHAQTYYRKNGQPSSELSWITDSLRPLRRLYGSSRAADFGPLALKAVRQEMIDAGKRPRRPDGLSRGVINRRIARVKRMFRWATENELVPTSVYHGLISVAGLAKGRCEAKDPEPIGPVADELVDAVRPYVSRQVWSMVQLQRLTGMRPGEAVAIRGCDLDTNGTLWVYTPSSHKTEHRGRGRTIELGPRVQAVLAPFLRPNVSENLFSPADAEAERKAELRRRRKSNVQPSQRDRSKPRAKRKPHDRYTVASYRRAVARGCERAFPPPPALARRKCETTDAWRARLTDSQKSELSDWTKAHLWHPHQLRHSFATMVRKLFGLDAARAVLGHSSPIVTEVYAEIDRNKSAEVAMRVG